MRLGTGPRLQSITASACSSANNGACRKLSQTATKPSQTAVTARRKSLKLEAGCLFFNKTNFTWSTYVFLQSLEGATDWQPFERCPCNHTQ